MLKPSSIAVILHFVGACAAAPSATLASTHTPHVPIAGSAPMTAGLPLHAFVAFSIEFSSLPDFAGNNSVPNTFSHNLLTNLAAFSGNKPHIRVGGNTQDYAVFNISQEVAVIGLVNPDISLDYPSTLTIGPAYFESYLTWPDVKFVHGFNLGRNSTAARQALVDSVPYACKALEAERLLSWELGNEPDLFKTSARGAVRPQNWSESDYVAEWLKHTREICTAMQQACPDLATDSQYRYYAPSFAGTSNSLDPLRTWQAGLGTDSNISIISSHNYISGASTPGVTLQGTLMNHTSTVSSIAKHINSSILIHAYLQKSTQELPYILGEANSLYNQGRPGLSNTFGAALWGIDFNLYCASKNISRVHMHMGTNYRYSAWQPVHTDIEAKGTKAPYYGSVAVAAFLGRSEDVSVVAAQLEREEEAAYVAYDRATGELKTVILLNMMGWNATDYNEGYWSNGTRPIEKYGFQIDDGFAGRTVALQRLLANGSDAISGITFDGYSYNYELDEGRPVLLSNVTRGEMVEVGSDGSLTVGVEMSSAVILRFDEE